MRFTFDHIYWSHDSLWAFNLNWNERRPLLTLDLGKHVFRIGWVYTGEPF